MLVKPANIAELSQQPTTWPTPISAPKERGWVILHRSWVGRFTQWGWTTADAFLSLAGEVVSGHPDRHVMQVHLPDQHTAFLKREHRVHLRDRWQSWRAGFGWSSKSVREAQQLQHLQEKGFSVPNWIAYGEDDSGKAFLLLEAVPDSIDLRQWLFQQKQDRDRRRILYKLAHYLAHLHHQNIDHPDLYAKHVLINPTTEQITLVDWQRSTQKPIQPQDRFHLLATLHATIGDNLLSNRQRLFFLRSYLQATQETSGSWAEMISIIQEESRTLLQRRGIREQRQIPDPEIPQRLVWLDGEAICAIPPVADAVACHQHLLHDPSKNLHSLMLQDDCQGVLQVRFYGSTWDRLRCRITGSRWRSEELRIARLLFHLEKYRILAPKLLAFGQRETSWHKATAFVLQQPISEQAVPLRVWWHAWCLQEEERSRQLRSCFVDSFGWQVRQLHEAGCVLKEIGPRGQPFVVLGKGSDYQIALADVQALQFQRQVSCKQRIQNLRSLWQAWGSSFTRSDWIRFLKGYQQVKRITPEIRWIIRGM